MRVVIALGGNMLLRKGQKPSIATQQKNLKRSLTHLLPLFQSSEVVITHGNGPQVGNILIRVEESLGKAYALPLDVCVAESEGELGYLIQQGLHGVLARKGIQRNIIGVLTQVVVDGDDPAFMKPTKPIGPYLKPLQVRAYRKKGLAVGKTAKGYRRVVASPMPLEILEKKSILQFLSKKNIIIAAGGGGIPVVKKGKQYVGVEAVIDKDHASAVLAHAIGADLLVLVTDVPYAYLNYRNNQKPIRRVSKKEMQNYFDAGHFLSGSMGPKVGAALTFLRKKGRKVLITDPPTLSKALQGKGGTIITS